MHLISDAIYHRDTDSGKVGFEEEQLLKTLMDANCGAGQIKRTLALKKHLVLTTDAVRFKMKGLKDGDNEGHEKLQELLAQVVEEGGHVNKLDNKDGTVRVLTVITKEMKQAYISINPSIIQIDTTYQFEVSGYKLCCIVYLNAATGRGEVGMMAFMEDESWDAYDFAFRTFKECICEDPSVIMIDKDFSELKALSLVFIQSTILLCWFHVLKWMKGIIHTAMTDLDHQSMIMESFRGLLYAHDAEIFQAELEEWYKVIDGVEVRIGSGEKKHYASLKDYYDKNWGSCEEMWAKHWRKKLPGMGSENTNNRVERAFGVMKKDLKLYTSGEVDFFKAVIHLVRWSEDQIKAKYTAAQRHQMRIFDPDPAVRELYSEAADVLNDSGCMMFKLSVEKFRDYKLFMEVDQNGVKDLPKNPRQSKRFEEKEASEDKLEDFLSENEVPEMLYQTDEKSCNCSFWIRHECPCRHILLFREWQGLPLFDKSLFSRKYDSERKFDLERVADRVKIDTLKFVQEDFEDSFDDVGEYTVFSREERYKFIQPMIGRISDCLLQFGTEQLRDYLAELEVVEQRLRTGKPIFSKSKSADKPSNTDLRKEGIADGSIDDCILMADKEKLENGKKVKADDENLMKNSKDKVEMDLFKVKIKGKVRRRGRPRGGRSKVRFIGRGIRRHSTFKKFNKRKVRRVPKSVFIADRNILSPSKFIHDLCSARGHSQDVKKSASNAKIKKCQAKRNEEFIDISDSEENNAQPTNPSNPLVCYFPSYPGARRSLNESDYMSLRPGRFLTDVTVDFTFCYEEFFRNQKEVCLLTTEFAQILGGGNWWNNPKVTAYLTDSKLWEPDGVKIVLLPVCFSSHFYGLAAVLDPMKPLIVVLESLGGSFSNAPPILPVFKNFLAEQRQLLNGSKTVFEVITPSVPRQPNSCDCGLFLVTFMRKIIEDPKDFVRKSKESLLSDWFPVEEVGGLRSEIATLLSLIAKEQRLPDGALAGKESTLPEIDFRY